MNKKTFTKIPDIVGVSEFRADMASHLARAKKHPVVISERRGDDSYVILSKNSYNNLIDAKEDAEDAIELARLVVEHKDATFIPWDSIRHA